MKGIMGFVRFLLPLWALLGKIFDFDEITKNRDKLKNALEQLKSRFGEVKITTDNIEKFVDVAELVKEMGGLDALHETLREAKEAGVLDELTSMFDPKETITTSSGGLERSPQEPSKIINIGTLGNININTDPFVAASVEAKVKSALINGIRIVEVAEREIGYKESPANSNRTKYGEWFGWNGVAWCGIFVSWVFAMARLQLPNIGFIKGFAGCMTAVEYFRKNGNITSEPQPGDLVFFDWNRDGRWDHVGIFVSWLDDGRDSFETIECNTSSTNQSNGGEVQRRQRSGRANYSVLFVHPEILK